MDRFPNSEGSVSVVGARSPHLVALPYPGRGHINPMLSLCRRLAASGVFVSFVLTEEWISLLSPYSSQPSLPSLMEQIHLLSIPNVLPSEKNRGADMLTFFDAVLTKMRAPVDELLEHLEPPPDVLLVDSILRWAPEIGGRRGIPVSSLNTQSAASFLALHHFTAASKSDGQSPPGERDDISMKGRIVTSLGEIEDRLDYLPRDPSAQLDGSSPHFSDQNMMRTLYEIMSWSTTSDAQAMLFTSVYELEIHSINALRSKFSIPIHPIGPAIPYMMLENLPFPDGGYKYYQWLSSQPESSVLYISLGSYIPISSSQMDEIAAGLKMSGIHFLWTTRIELESMKDFDGRDDATGFVVNWCDQLRVLCHPSIGGFLTHCGWNSVLEAVYAGVPMLTFPLLWDQYPNSKMVVDDWKIGLRLKGDEDGNQDVGREKIAQAVRSFMVAFSAKEEIKEMRNKARELKDVCCNALKRSGSSSVSLHAFVQQICARKG